MYGIKIYPTEKFEEKVHLFLAALCGPKISSGYTSHGRAGRVSPFPRIQKINETDYNVKL